MKVIHNNKEYQIILSFHLSEKREYSRFSRNDFLNENRFQKILKQGFKYGLLSFNNKEKIVISIFDERNRQYDILLSMEENIITIITVYVSKIQYVRNFLKIENRINLWAEHHKIESLNKTEFTKQKQKNSLNLIDKECFNDDIAFKNYAYSNKIRKI